MVEVVFHVPNPSDALPSAEAQRHREMRQDDRERSQDGPTDDNAATAPGKKCELCGELITARQEVRRRVSGEWIHEACPIH